MTRILQLSWLALLIGLPISAFPDCNEGEETNSDSPYSCQQMENITILGTARQKDDIAGAANVIDAEYLDAFAMSDVTRALRQVPGASLQNEDGYGLRPNISIRGTPTERSSRITLLEDNVLIAPAPYAAPSAYYFPTFGRINAVEVLKGPASITQGPYTIGGALNLLATPIPDRESGMLSMEGGSDSTWRAHAWYGDSGPRSAWLVETHQWQSDGYQHIDRSDAKTGLDKSDYMARLAFSSDPTSEIYQRLDIKLQSSTEDSQQSYLGLSDEDFGQDPLRRYGLSALDNLNNTHEQVVVSWHVEPSSSLSLFITAYNNDTTRAWYKTEGIDFDGSSDSGSFSRTSWSSVISAVNYGNGLGGLGVNELIAILDGGDTLPGSIQLRNNAREYYSRGIQAGGTKKLELADTTHEISFGIRFHKDQEDRLQRNDSYQQVGGALILSDVGLQGNAGNRIQQADARSFFIQDRIERGSWVFTPGIRYEDITQERINFGADPLDLSGREPIDIKSTRSNREDFWIPGVGVLFEANDSWSWLGGVHKGFSAPGNKQGVKAEESVNYEAGFRYRSAGMQLEAIAFFQDYENLQGSCTASSGSGCEIGDVFNGDAVSIPGMELTLTSELAPGREYSIPLQLAYTWMNARFDSDIADSEFFGDVSEGDPVPYIPDHQWFVSVGFEKGQWSSYLSGSYVDSVCTFASCGQFERTESALTIDLAVHYRLTPNLELFSVLENAGDELVIAGRQPYGARPGKTRSWILGARLDF